MGIGRRILTYLIVGAVLFFIISCIVIYQHRDYLAQYFSSSLSASTGLILYLLIFGVGISLMLRAVFR